MKYCALYVLHAYYYLINLKIYIYMYVKSGGSTGGVWL